VGEAVSALFGERMDRTGYERKAIQYLQELCITIPGRRLGSDGNRQATAFFSDVLKELDFDVASQPFDCLDWENQGASLTAGGNNFEVMSSPYSQGCDQTAPLAVVHSIDELKEIDTKGRILLLMDEIAVEQLMPKNFPFYNPDHHQEIYALLESKSPLAIITATSRNPELAGGMYPFPMIEDGDFNIPSVYMKDVDGKRLALHEDKSVSLQIEAQRIPSSGANVVGKLGPEGEARIVLCAHIDAKEGTPGALDNGTGVVMLLILAELIGDYTGPHQLELLAFNGEDHYSAQGHKEYIRLNKGRFDEIALAINTDVAGYYEGHTAYSLYDCPVSVESAIHKVMAGYEGLQKGERWYQSDHSIFIQQGRPAMAITSDRFMELSTHVTHTSKDSVDLVDIAKIVEVAQALRDFLFALR
jgi:aminopeptidase YwaD